MGGWRADPETFLAVKGEVTWLQGRIEEAEVQAKDVLVILQ